MDPVPRMPLFAPLAEDQVRDLVVQREKTLPRPGGRPRRGAGDKISRYEQRLLQALDVLVPEVAEARQRVFALLHPLVHDGKLTRRALLDILYPAPLTPYPARLYEWRNEQFLFLDQHGDPEAQTSAAILLQRELDERKRKLPPPRLKPQSFFCWRLDLPEQREPLSYEMPLVVVDNASPSVLKPRPVPSPDHPYILYTPWKGVAWDDIAWNIFEGGAARWVGLPSEDQLAAWLSPQEVASLVPSAGQVDRAEQALRILADRLKHNLTSDEPT